jgi:signal transduction histidine kinase
VELIAGERIDRFLTRLYARLGDRYLARFWLGTWIAFIIGASSAATVSIAYLHPSTVQFLGLLGLSNAGVVAMMLLASRIWLARQRVFVAWWQAGRPADRAVRVWKVVAGLRVAWLFGWPLGILTFGVPTAVYSVVVIGRGVGTGAALLAGWVAAGGYAALLGFFTVELYTRPVLHDAAERMPADFVPERARVPIARRLFAALLMISGSTGFFLSVGLSIGSGSFSRFALGLGITVASTLTTALLCTVMITGSTAGAVAELLKVTRRIRAGELGARVPISSADEFGLLAASFNDMTAELRHSQARIVASADAERRRVERDLHDGAQQRLVLIKLKLGQLGQKIRANPETAVAFAGELSSDLDRALAELRELARGIYPPLLESDGLPGALTEAAVRAAIPVSVDCDGAGRYPPELEAAIYFCCLEALQNAAKHAGAGARATIRLAAADNALEFVVTDDGVGYDPDTVADSTGLRNMADRVGALGGTLRIDSKPGAGTRVLGRIAVERNAARPQDHAQNDHLDE